VLVTNSRKSMPKHLRDHLASGRHVPGIFIVNMRLPLVEIADELVFIAHTSREGEHRDRVQFLPVT